MARTSTLYRFLIELADMERHVYESLDLRVARHPSEDAERMVLRLLARVLAHEEGLEFGRGLSTTEDAALSKESLTGELLHWIDVGCPSAERLHRASKAAGRVSVYTSKGDAVLRKEWSSRPVHKSTNIEVVRLPASFVESVASLLERKNIWYVTIQEGLVRVGDDATSFEAAFERTSVAEVCL